MATFDHQVHFSWRRSCAIVFIGAAILSILAWQASLPIKRSVAERYVKRGDTLVVQHKFDEAEEEYASALHYNGSSEVAAERKRLTELTSTDIAAARQLFIDLDQADIVAKIDTATAAYNKPKEALEVGVKFYEASEYSLARYPLEKATELDPAYPEAWHYLSLVYDKLAAENTDFRPRADDARAKRDALSPRWIE
jgi:Tfp pilus assembly protein PilF